MVSFSIMASSCDTLTSNNVAINVQPSSAVLANSRAVVAAPGHHQDVFQVHGTPGSTAKKPSPKWRRSTQGEACDGIGAVVACEVFDHVGTGVAVMVSSPSPPRMRVGTVATEEEVVAAFALQQVVAVFAVNGVGIARRPGPCRCRRPRR